MIRLAMDTSCAPSSLALALSAEQPPITYILDADKAGAEHLVCEISHLLDKAGVGFRDLDEIIVACGPGPFIGLRIGLAAARGLALAAQKPIKAASTFVVFAATAPSEKDSIIIALQPSTSQRIIWQCFDHDLSPLSPMHIASFGDFETYLSKNPAAKIHLTGWAASQMTGLSAEIVPLDKPLAALLLALPECHLSAPPEPLYPPS